ncbi:MAG TPA: aldehyde dehydrogenase [Methanocorpusculum sp.]|nr:aldehyde dehydrogenase [Methanocorpusculum sp.]
MTTIPDLVEKQKTFFHTGATLPVEYRISALKKIGDAILRYEPEILNALKTDLKKSATEAYMCEVGLIKSELRFMQKKIRSFARDVKVKTPLVSFPGKSYVRPMPYGVVLIMSPWNYPFLLTLGPLVDALAAGNTAIIKPSAYSPASSALLKKIIEDIFSPEYVAVITGGRDENAQLLDEKYDYIFFTGSTSVAKVVLERAAVHVTPVTLELGGKSPCIIDKSADIPLTARRIVFGKLINCGQTCIAPDYVLCDSSVHDALIKSLKEEIERQYGSSPLENPDYGKIINEKHFDRILKLIDSAKVVYGGTSNRATLQIEPTILDNVTFDDAVMKEEIFGPIIPVISVSSVDEAIEIVTSRPKPLALYAFSQHASVTDRIMTVCSFGGGCINDTIMHISTSAMGFGGVGESGMGSYHGRRGFETFSHRKSIVDRKSLDLSLRYQPYSEKKSQTIHRFLK